MTTGTSTSGDPAMVATPNPTARVLVVGELNPFGADPRAALYPLPRASSGNRLRVIMGLSDPVYLHSLDRVNLCDARWSPRVARERARLLVARRESNHINPVFVLLGSRVRVAFLRDQGDRDFLRSVRSPEGRGFGIIRRDHGEQRVSTVVCLPHPSGLCRAWNDPGSVARARVLLLDAAPEIWWGRSGESLPSSGAAT